MQERQSEWDNELHEIINSNPELSGEQVWLSHIEKLKFNHSLKGFYKHLLK